MWTEDGPWNDDTVTNTWNNRLRVGMDLKQPTGVWTNKFIYDASRRLTNVTSKAGSFSYLLAVGAPSTLTVRLGLPNTSYITNVYDVNARLLSTTLKNSSHSTLNSHQYSYNLGNQRTQQVFNTPWSTVNYAYDPIGQFKVADSASASEDRAYDYDSAWNLTNRTINTTPQTFQVDGLNQLTNSTPGGVSTYDGNGNLISSGGGVLELTYDDENRLSTVQSNLVVYGTNYGFWKTLYAYDGIGRLRQRVELQVMMIPADPPPETDLISGQEFLESVGGGHPWGTNSITHYIYDGWRVIQERNGSNNVPTVSYTRGTDLSGTLEGAGGIGGLLGRSHGYSSGNWSTHNFYHADGNGNITYLTSSSQTLAGRYRYDPYGNLISSSEILAYLGTPNTYRFSSKMVDLKTGLYYYGYRWYAAGLQRWLNQDPIGEYVSINLYAFVYNEPTDLFDSDGLDSGPRPGSKGGGPGNKPRPFKDRPGIPPRPGGEGDECHEWHEPGAICSPEWFLHQAGHGLMNFLGWCFSSSPPTPPPPALPLLPPPDRGCSNCPQNAPPPIIIIIITLPTPPPPPVHVNFPAFPVSR